MEKFDIKLVCAYETRPMISVKIVEYFKHFVLTNILVPKNIIIHSKPNILLAFTLMETGGKLSSEVKVLKSQTVGGDKFYPIIIPMDQIWTNNTSMKIIELFFEAVKLFFIKNYKRIKSDFFDELWQMIDLPYLLNLPYPAPIKEVKYIGDTE